MKLHALRNERCRADCSHTQVRIGGVVVEEPLGVGTVQDRLVGKQVLGFVKKLDADSSLALLFGSPVLVPCLHLGVAELKLGGQLHAILNRQIHLGAKAGLQLLELVVGEGGARLPLLPLLALIPEDVLDEEGGVGVCCAAGVGVLVVGLGGLVLVLLVLVVRALLLVVVLLEVVVAAVGCGCGGGCGGGGGSGDGCVYAEVVLVGLAEVVWVVVGGFKFNAGLLLLLLLLV